MTYNAVELKLGALEPETTALFICDLQEKFQSVIPHFDNIIENTAKLIKGCKLLGIPIVVTEQYPEKLGKTSPGLDIEGCYLFPKTLFSMATNEIKELLSQLCKRKLKSVILLGIESHICIEQTAIELRSRLLNVHVVADCCGSRSQECRVLAFEAMKQNGCYVTSGESVLFKLLKSKDHPKFKEISALVQQISKPTGLPLLPM